MNILALDLGTKTGWASYVDLTIPGMLTQAIMSSGVQKFVVPRGTNPDVRFLLFEKWLDDVCLLKHPEVIAYEMPHMRGGGASDLLIGFMTVVRMFCVKHDILYMSVHSGTLKKHATGSGKASKEEMVFTAEQRYGKVQDDNQADALHILAWAKEKVNVDSVATGDKEVPEGTQTPV